MLLNLMITNNTLEHQEPSQHSGFLKPILHVSVVCLLYFLCVVRFLKIFLAKRAIALQLHFAKCFSTVKNIELTIFKPI